MLCALWLALSGLVSCVLPPQPGDAGEPRSSGRTPTGPIQSITASGPHDPSGSWQDEVQRSLRQKEYGTTRNAAGLQ
ncbi:MAG: hypothetical protein CL908_06880, partial [Deltaproteobacteria bacterium]|nr:hypothetical protein [Deltaproteobacteria bacterium]